MSNAETLFFRNASQLLTLAGPPVPRRGGALGELGIVKDGGLLIQRGKIVLAGRTRDLAKEARRLRARVIDCTGRVVMPGFVDCHTHLVFAGNRVDDFERRIQGKTYEQIAAAGGGIRHTARLFSEASAHSIEAQATRYMTHFVEHGTTTMEAKSGYGLDVANEIKALEIIARLRKTSPVEIVPTLLAAHSLPQEFQGRRGEYIDLITHELIQKVAKRKLAEFVDCFCDRGAFSVPECRRIFRAALRLGLKPRVHADQLAQTRATLLALQMGAASADHLDQIHPNDVAALAASKTVAILIPSANFHLALDHYAPARKLIEAGAAVALATDFNPGTCPTLNMQFVLSLACSAMRMTPAEAVSAATINAAYSLRRSERLGSLEPGKQADLVVMDVRDYREIPYYFAWNHCVMTVKRGRIIYSKAKHANSC
jgi:imidazolonepropionase